MKKILTITMMLIGVLSLFSSCKKDDTSKPIYQNKWILVDESEGADLYVELGENGKGVYGALVNEAILTHLKSIAENKGDEMTEEQKKAINNIKVNDVCGVDITYSITFEADGKTADLLITIPSLSDKDGNPESLSFKCSIESKDLILLYHTGDSSAYSLRSASSLKISVGKYYSELGSFLFGD